VAEIEGDRGDWTVVRSRKRKATEPELRGQDMLWISDRHAGAVSGDGQVRNKDTVRVFNGRLGLQHDDKVQFDGRVSNEYGSRAASAEWHNSDVVEYRNKASFYVTSFPDNMSLFLLRQAFEVCGILTDVFIARHHNIRGQEFGFVRYVKVKIRKNCQRL